VAIEGDQMPYVVEKVEDTRLNSVQKRLHRGKWVVLDPLITISFDFFDTKEEAEFQAGLLNAAEEAVETITSFANEILSKLSPAAREYLYEYVGGYIVIPI